MAFDNCVGKILPFSDSALCGLIADAQSFSINPSHTTGFSGLQNMNLQICGG